MITVGGFSVRLMPNTLEPHPDDPLSTAIGSLQRV
jgi:hypothetical protein